MVHASALLALEALPLMRAGGMERHKVALLVVARVHHDVLMHLATVAPA